MNKIIEHIDKIGNEGRKLQLDTTYKTLEQVDETISYYLNNYESIRYAVVIDIYGLLQSLFVGIDSLYSLSIGITNNKFYINVNQNKTLNELKHIRNDIVGHPTNRRYGESGVGYSIIDIDALSYFLFKYKTFVYQGKKFTTNETNVDLKKMVFEYRIEKEIIFKRLVDYIETGYSKVGLEDDINKLLIEPSNLNLQEIKNSFIKTYGNLGNHRFMWRIELLEKLLKWQDNDPEIKSLIEYMIKMQIMKLLQINNSMIGKNYSYRHLKIPYILKRFYKFLDNNKGYVEYISNLHDVNSPFFDSDLSYLLDEIKDKQVLKYLMLIKYQNDSDKIYLLGSTLKNYKK